MGSLSSMFGKTSLFVNTAAVAPAWKQAGFDVNAAANYGGPPDVSKTPPPNAPDLTDELVRRRRVAAAISALQGSGRASTMPGAGGSTFLTAGADQLGKTFLGGL